MITIAVGSLIFILHKFDNIIDKAIGIIACILLFAIAAVILWILFAGLKKGNYFLFDFKQKKSIAIDELTFEMIEEKLDLYYGAVVLYSPSLFDRLFKYNPFDIMPKPFKLLFPVYMIYSMIKANQDETWHSFGNAPKERIDKLENAIFRAGATEISERLQYLRANYSGDSYEIKTFFLSEKKYLQNFIIQYVKERINEF